MLTLTCDQCKTDKNVYRYKYSIVKEDILYGEKNVGNYYMDSDYENTYESLARYKPEIEWIMDMCDNCYLQNRFDIRQKFLSQFK